MKKKVIITAASIFLGLALIAGTVVLACAVRRNILNDINHTASGIEALGEMESTKWDFDEDASSGETSHDATAEDVSGDMTAEENTQPDSSLGDSENASSGEHAQEASSQNDSGKATSGENATEKASTGNDKRGENSTEEPTTKQNTDNSHNVVGDENGDGYEGIKGTGSYNYGEALQKSILFYELQRCGELPETVRCNWRGDSCLNDGSDVGLDLTGGWIDAGDNVKFNLPMSYSAAMLAWSIYEDYDAYRESGQLEYALANIKWANDYFIKCHPEDEVYYYQVGNGGADHGFWGPVEVVEYKMDRPSYKVTAQAPGSAVTGETAASLALCSILYKDIDRAYSELCLKHAKSLYAFAEKYKSDAGYTAANGFYNSWSGFYDELAWAGAWLYLATGDKTYITKAKEFYPKACQDYNWAMCWDDVHIGAAVMLSRITGDKVYSEAVEKHLDYWTTGTKDGQRIKYTPKGLAWLDQWGSLRYASTTAFIALVYTDDSACSSSRRTAYVNFAEKQANYILGDTGFSYLIGFGDDYPKNPHHRTAQGSYADNMNEPSYSRHTLYGALVGGPDASDNYSDKVSDYVCNEVACDYNAGFTGLLAKMYSKYGGETIANFGAIETTDEKEYYVEAGINASGTDFMEIKAIVYNKTAWPARASKNAELRYFIDLGEVYEAGSNASGITISTNYMQDAFADGLKVWDEDNHIYYLSVRFQDGKLYPGGQDKYKKEIQVRMKSSCGVWNNDNDPSFAGMRTGSLSDGIRLALYEDGKLVYGTEPPKGINAGNTVIGGGTITSGSNKDSEGNSSGNNEENNGNTETQPTETAGNSSSESAQSGDLSVNINYSDSSVGGIMTVKNNGSGTIQLSDLEIKYYFTKDNDTALQFACYHSAVQTAEGAYNAVSGCEGSFADYGLTDADTLCTISFSDSTTLPGGAVLTVNFNINHSDWSAFNLSNDYSKKSAENIVICEKTKVLFGKEPA